MALSAWSTPCPKKPVMCFLPCCRGNAGTSQIHSRTLSSLPKATLASQSYAKHESRSWTQNQALWSGPLKSLPGPPQHRSRWGWTERGGTLTSPSWRDQTSATLPKSSPQNPFFKILTLIPFNILDVADGSQSHVRKQSHGQIFPLETLPSEPALHFESSIWLLLGASVKTSI